MIFKGVSPVLILIVASGPEKGRIYELLDDTDVIIGRDGERIRLSDRKASRRHARLWCEDGQWYVQDLKSRHGTKINQQSVRGSVAVENGDFIQTGNTVLVLATRDQQQTERLALLGGSAVAASSDEADAADQSHQGDGDDLADDIDTPIEQSLASDHDHDDVDELQTQLANVLDDRHDAPVDAPSEAGPYDFATAAATARKQHQQLHGEVRSLKRTTIIGTLAACLLIAATAGLMFSGLFDQGAADLDPLSQQIADADARQQGAAKQLADQLAKVQSAQNAQVAPALDQLVAAAGDASQTAKTQSEKLAALDRQLANLAGMSQRIGEIDQRLAKIDQQNQAIQKQSESLTRIASTLDALTHAVEQDASPAMLASLDRKLTHMQDRLRDASEVATSQGDGTGDEAMLAQQAKQFAALQEQVARLRDQIGSLSAVDGSPVDADKLAEHISLAVADVIKQHQQQPVGPDPLFTSLLESVQQQKQALADQTNAITQQGQTLASMDQSLAALDKIDGMEHRVATAVTEQVSDRVAKHVDARLDQTDDALTLSMAVLEARQQQQGDQLTEQLAQSTQALEQASTVQADRVVAEVAQVAQAVGEQPTIEAIAAAAAEHTARLVQSGQLELAKAVKSNTDAALAQLKAQQAAAMDNSRQVADELATQLASLLEQVQKQSSAPAKLERIVAILEGQDDKQADLLAQVRLALADQHQSTAQQLIRQLRPDGSQNLDKLRTALREEIKVALAQERLAMARRAIINNRQSTYPQGAGHSSGARAASDQPMVAAEDTTVGEDGLTATQRAYKMAFESGKVVNLGQGTEDPTTGKRSPGRTLDPSQARASGVKSWREWYLIDDFNERMRLQRQAMLYHTQQEDDDHSNVIRLPDSQ